MPHRTGAPTAMDVQSVFHLKREMSHTLRSVICQADSPFGHNKKYRRCAFSMKQPQI